MPEAPDDLQDLRQRIDRLQQATEVKPSEAKAKAKAMSHAYRLLTELSACVGVGLLIGYWLDKAFDTRPWLMLVFFFLGVASGCWTLYKLAAKQE